MRTFFSFVLRCSGLSAASTTLWSSGLFPVALLRGLEWLGVAPTRLLRLGIHVLQVAVVTSAMASVFCRLLDERIADAIRRGGLLGAGRSDDDFVI